MSVRVAIIDSGVNPAHPHVGGIAGGVAIGVRGNSADSLDYLGHGTAVAGAIREKAPEAELYCAKVFDRTLRTSIERILRAIDWALEQRVHLINLSLGTHNPAHCARFKEALDRVAAGGAVLLTPRATLPGSLDGALAVEVDWDCPRHVYRSRIVEGRLCFHASGYPRPIPGRRVDENLSGISFAVANMTGFAALVCADTGAATLEQVTAFLKSRCDSAGP